MPVHAPKSEKIRGSFSILVAKWSITGLLLFLPHCKLIAPDSFLDPTPDNNELLKTMNVRNNGELWSGVVAGDLSGEISGAKIQFDDGPWLQSVQHGSRWVVFIPTGSKAIATGKSWRTGSKHTLCAKALSANGNAGRQACVKRSFILQANRDVNADGYADVVVGAIGNTGSGASGGQANSGIANKGAVYVFYGSSEGIKRHEENPTPYYCVGPPDCTVMANPDNFGGYFGSAVSFAGDANGDGFADIVIGASSNSGAGSAGGQSASTATNKGAAYVFYGSKTGITRHDESASPYFCGGPPDCTVITNPDDFGGAFGSSVASAGDVNGDGFLDIVIGAQNNTGASASSPQTASAAVGKGSVYIYYGSENGYQLHAEGSTTYYCGSTSDCTVVANPDDFGGKFGASVSYAGDVNADGYDDIIVGAYANDGSASAGGQVAGPANKGAAYVFYGSPTGITKHDEGPTPYFCGGGPDCTVVQNPDNYGGYFGGAVANAGDLNGDGISDVVIAAKRNDGTGAAGGQTIGASQKGAVYVFFGSATGIVLHSESTSPYYCSGLPDCTVAQNPDNNGLGNFGDSVSGLGDANADGFADIFVGAGQNNGASAAGGQIAGASAKGAAYVFYGSSTGIALHAENSTAYYCSGFPDCTVVQNPDNRSSGTFGRKVSAAGDINADGFADAIAGGASNYGLNAAGGQTLGATSKGAAYAFFGSVSGITRHDENATPYYCGGPPDCTVIQNPDNVTSGNFGYSVGSLAPALRPSPASLNHPGTPSPFMARGWGWGQNALPARREEDIA